MHKHRLKKTIPMMFGMVLLFKGKVIFNRHAYVGGRAVAKCWAAADHEQVRQP